MEPIEGHCESFQVFVRFKGMVLGFGFSASAALTLQLPEYLCYAWTPGWDQVPPEKVLVLEIQGLGFRLAMSLKP